VTKKIKAGSQERDKGYEKPFKVDKLKFKLNDNEKDLNDNVKVINREPKTKNNEKLNDKNNNFKFKAEDKKPNLDFNNALSKQHTFGNSDNDRKDIQIKLKNKKVDNHHQKIQVKRNSIMNKLRDRNN